MLQPATLQFLKEIAKNNTKEWFDKNRQQYDDAKQDVATLTANIIKAHGKKDPEIASLEVKDCTFRINRDVRFSKDKSPYKTNFGISINRGGKKSPFAGYYFHIQPEGNSFIGGGLWLPEAAALKKVRQEIDYHWEDWQKEISNKKFKTQFGDFEKSKEWTLIREPKGYEKDNPAIEYLKLKSFIASRPLTDEELIQKDLVKKILDSMEALQPFIYFFNRALEH